MTDLYNWRVTYDDGTIVDEYDETAPDGRGFAEVTIDRVRSLALVPREDHGSPAELVVTIPSGETMTVAFYLPKLPGHAVTIPVQGRPIFFRQRSVIIHADDVTEAGQTAHCIGYQETLHGRNHAVYHFIREDGSSVISDTNVVV